MKLKTVIGLLAVGTLFYVAHKAMGNGLLGSNNSGVADAKNVSAPTSKSDDRKIELMGMLSDLEAKFYGFITSAETKEAIQQKIDAAVQELKSLS